MTSLIDKVPAADLKASTTFKKGIAVAFTREAAVLGAGHAGWGFKLKNGKYCFGGTENPMSDKGPLWGAWGSWHQGTKVQGGDNAAWIGYGTESEMWERMKNPPYPYDYAKTVEVLKPNAAKAHAEAVSNTKAGFTGLGNNCLDATYRVLVAYGASDLPWPSTNWLPNGWFNAVKYKNFYRLRG